MIKFNYQKLIIILKIISEAEFISISNRPIGKLNVIYLLFLNVAIHKIYNRINVY